MPAAPPSPQRRLRQLRRHLAPAANSVAAAANERALRTSDSTEFCRGVDMGAAHEALSILRHFQGERVPEPTAAAAAAVSSGVADMVSDVQGLPKASRYIGCVVDASRAGGLESFSDAELADMKRGVHARGALVVRGVNPSIDGNASNAQSVAAFLSHFGEPRAEYFGDRESELGATKWNSDLPVGTLQKFSNDGDGVLLKSSSDELAEAGELAWHFDGEFNPWWTSHTALFCEANPYAGHSTGYTSQRAAYLAALADGALFASYFASFSEDLGALGAHFRDFLHSSGAHRAVARDADSLHDRRHQCRRRQPRPDQSGLHTRGAGEGRGGFSGE